MAFNLTRSLCTRTNPALFKWNPQLNSAARCVSIRVVPTPPALEESHDDRNFRFNRPQSPHLTVYKLQLTAVLSITHRFTGMALTGYAAILGLSTLALPDGANTLISMVEALQLSAPILIMGKWTIAFPATYHVCNGVRHLIWDSGRCLSIKQVYATGYGMLFSAYCLATMLSFL